MGGQTKRAAAVVFSLLIATSMVVTPVLANGGSTGSTATRSEFVDGTDPFDRVGPNGPPNQTKSKRGPPDHAGPGNSPPDGADGNGTNRPVVNENFTANTSTGALLRAASHLYRLEPDSQAEADAVNDTLVSINASLSESRSFRRADSEASFEHLKDAQKDLKTVAKETDNETAVENASRLLYEASALNSKRAIYHAELSFDRYGDAFPNHGQERKTDQAIINARAAFERGDSAVPPGTPRRGPPGDSLEQTIQSHANGITHHRTAWRHAERALETIAKHTEPRLTLRQGHAFEENESIHVRLEAVVTDARAHAFDEANVTLENGTTEPIEFGSQATISRTTGSTELDLGPRPENQTVTVTVTSSDNPGRSVEETLEIRIEERDIHWDLPAPDEYARASVTDSESNVTVDVEGDGVHKSLISVANRSTETGSQYRAGPMVRIVNETSFDQAEVRVPINETVLENTDGNLTIYKWDPSSDERWHAVETDIDPDNLTATTTVSEFSYFTVAEAGASQSYQDRASPGWPQLDDFQSVDGWDRTGSVSVVNGTAVLESQAEDDENDGGSGGGIGGGGDDGSDDEDGADDGNEVTDPPELCLPIVGCVELPPLPLGGLGSAAIEQSSHDIATQSPEEHARLTRTAEIPAGAERVWFETRVKSSATDGNATIIVEGESDSKLVHLNLVQSDDWITEEADLSEFEGEEVTVRIETQGTAELRVDYVGILVDSTGSGFPDEVERLDLRMPVGEDGVRNTPLNLDPNRADTSGNGLRDSEIVDIEWGYDAAGSNGQWQLEGEAVDAEAHPARIDTTGDGLTDAEQLEGWEITYTSSREDSLELLSKLQDADSIDELEASESDFLETETASPDPLSNYTDIDGVSDAKERRLGTDPESRDTTGDGIPDWAYRGGEYDPTLFDVSSPEIIIEDADFNDPNVDVSGLDLRDWEARVAGSYEVEFTVDGLADPEEARVIYNGDVEETVPLGNRRRSGDVKFDIGTVDTFTDAFTGSLVTVEAEDEHEVINGVGSTEVPAVEVNGVWAAASEEIRAQGVSDARIERNLGTLQGVTYGAGESAESVQALYESPVESIAALREIPAAIVNLDEVIAAMPESIEKEQHDNNPHDPEDRYYESYRQGWYEGYIAWFVIESAIPVGKAGSAVKSSKRIQKTVDRLSGPRIRQAARMAGRVDHATKAPIRYGKLQFSRGLSTGIGVTKKTGERILSPVPTVGKQYQVSKLLSRHDIDGGKLNRYSPDEQRKVGEFTNRYGDEGAEIASEGGPVFQQIAASDTLDAATTDRIVRAYDQRIIDEDDIQRIARGLDEGDIDQEAIHRALGQATNLDQNGHAIERLRAADEVNAEYPSNYDDPYASGTIAVEYVTETEEKFVRVHRESNQVRSWTMRRHQIEGLEPVEIQEKFSLPEEPVYVSDVGVPAGTRMRTGVVESNFGGQRGATQFELREKIPSENFDNQREIQP
ncbi:VWA domain-containing protein [Natrinema sp. H-ect1]|uniref:VWA domain-containing protein n=1 Tax=Natrinema sp. H-ect1 TaxID=3242700 RepID=UPI00359E24B3